MEQRSQNHNSCIFSIGNTFLHQRKFWNGQFHHYPFVGVPAVQICIRKSHSGFPRKNLAQSTNALRQFLKLGVGQTKDHFVQYTRLIGVVFYGNRIASAQGGFLPKS